MRRFTRLTNGFSKKLENLKAAVSLHFAHYNFVRLHSSLLGGLIGFFFGSYGISDDYWDTDSAVS